MKTFIVLYEDRYEKEGCEDCNCDFSQEIKGIYSTFQKAENAIQDYIKRMDAFNKDDFIIKEIQVDRKM